MADDEEKPKFYRKRAAELRAHANETISHQAREGLISVAYSYESIAASLELIKETKRTLGLLKDSRLSTAKGPSA